LDFRLWKFVETVQRCRLDRLSAHETARTAGDSARPYLTGVRQRVEQIPIVPGKSFQRILVR
jgi:hypothetical protein